MVQLVTRVKQKFTELVKGCELSFNEMDTSVNLNELPLGSYDILIGMDWLESHSVVIDYLNKSFVCLDEEGNHHSIKGIYRSMSIRQYQ